MKAWKLFSRKIFACASFGRQQSNAKGWDQETVLFFLFYLIVVCFSGVFPNRLTVPRRQHITSHVDTFCSVVRYFCSILRTKKKEIPEKNKIFLWANPPVKLYLSFVIPLGRKLGEVRRRESFLRINLLFPGGEFTALLGMGTKSDKFRLQRWLERQWAPPSWLGM